MRRVKSESSRRGVALIYAVFGAFVAGSMVVVMLTAASVTRDKSELKADKLQARYLAEGGVEAAKKEIQTALANWRTPNPNGSITIAGTVVDYSIEARGPEDVVSDASGFQTIQQPYQIEARARIGDALVLAHRVVNARSTPIFQFAVFYDEDLEIGPGPSMTLSGRVHTNGDMYVGCGNTLALNTNYVHAVGEMFRRRKDNTTSSGTVDIRKWVVNPFSGTEPTEYVTMSSEAQMDALGIDTVSGFDCNFQDGFDADGDGLFTGEDDWLPWGPGALDTWDEPDGYTDGEGNTVLTGEHGITEAVPPDVGSIHMFDPQDGGDYALDPDTNEFEFVGAGNGTHAKGFFHANAGLSFVVNAAGNSWKAYDASGAEVTGSVAGAVNLGSVYDSRQGGNVKVLKLNVGALAASGAYPSNGLIYCSHYGMGPGTRSKGIQLNNGAELYKIDAGGRHIPAPLTVATEGSLFVKGDYNITNKVGAAVIADAVNLLSNAWNGTKTGLVLPAASNTTYNVAMITGNHETLGASYNGGLENLPRFHENWNGMTATIRGSFVNTWYSDYATGTWLYGGNRYTAPIRNWMYDTAFNRVSSLPPFTPMVVSAEDIVSW